MEAQLLSAFKFASLSTIPCRKLVTSAYQLLAATEFRRNRYFSLFAICVHFLFGWSNIDNEFYHYLWPRHISILHDEMIATDIWPFLEYPWIVSQMYCAKCPTLRDSFLCEWRMKVEKTQNSSNKTGVFAIKKQQKRKRRKKTKQRIEVLLTAAIVISQDHIGHLRCYVALQQTGLNVSVEIKRNLMRRLYRITMAVAHAQVL